MAEDKHETLYTEEQARQIEQGVVTLLRQQTGLDFTAVLSQDHLSARLVLGLEIKKSIAYEFNTKHPPVWQVRSILYELLYAIRQDAEHKAEVIKNRCTLLV